LIPNGAALRARAAFACAVSRNAGIEVSGEKNGRASTTEFFSAGTSLPS
jgi:hypothetical protein